MRRESPHNIDNNVSTHTALIAYDRVLNYSGASLRRDAVDVRIVSEVRNKTFTHAGSNGSTNGIIDTQSDVGGWPQLNSEAAPVSTSGDGIPDEWKITKKLDATKAQANGRDLSTAYDNIEVYLNGLTSHITNEQNKLN
jgi:hypothetical protein